MILILCTGNSCRSQLAETILQQALGGTCQVASTGSKSAGYVHMITIAVLAEIGLDISSRRSKSLEEFLDQDVETVITVCSHADQACPMFPGQVNRHHFPFGDPAHVEGTEDEKLAAFRRTRDEIQRLFEAYACGRLDAKRK